MKPLKITLGLLLLFCFSFIQAGIPDEVIEIAGIPDEVIEIDVAPNVLNIASSGTVVTVHTDIAYFAVEGASVTLNGVAIDYWKSDSRGQFVAKFDMQEVETLVTEKVLSLGDITLELKGLTVSKEEFSGTQVIKVINIIPAGKK